MIRTPLLATFILISSCHSIWAAEVMVSIDKTTQQMSVFVDGVQTYDWPVSTGRSGYDTPTGTHVASSMNEIWYSKQWDNAPMPHSIFFTKNGHAIHGTQEIGKLGTAASHGCVRLAPENAETLYRLVEENGLESTQVVLAGEVYPEQEEEYPEREPDIEAQPDYPQPDEVEPRYDDPYGEYRMPLPPPAFGGVPDGFQFYGPGFQFQFKLDRKRERKWRKKWRRYYD